MLGVSKMGAVFMNLVVTFEGKTRSVGVNEEKLVIGRKSRSSQPDVDLNPDRTVSRRHAVLWREDGRYWIEDLGSALGTRVNGLRKPKTEVKFGDTIHIGKSAIKLLPSSVSEMKPQFAE